MLVSWISLETTTNYYINQPVKAQVNFLFRVFSYEFFRQNVCRTFIIWKSKEYLNTGFHIRRLLSSILLLIYYIILNLVKLIIDSLIHV